MAIKNAEELLTLVVERLKPMKPKKVILFGSYAKGEADEFSDLDIIVVAETNLKFIDRIGKAIELIDLPMAVDCLVYTPDEFEKMIKDENPFIQKALEEGIVVELEN